jgi:dTDP-4-dehydrorhamnose reductase
MKILVTGAKGMLGTDLVRILEEHSHKVFATDIEELDITQFDSVKKMVSDISPDVIVNCAAYTDVDKAEEEPEKAFLINSTGVRNLALVCKDLDIELCHISTDYVFDGTKEGPYAPDDLPNPINTYGKSKLAGEEHVQKICNKFYIVRTSWLYGKHGKNFVYTILDLAKKRKELRVVDDQIGSPTWTVTLAQAVAKIIQTQKYGIYHVTDKTENGISWYQFACEIVRLSGLKTEAIPVKTGEFSLLARRPLNSVLDQTRIKSVLNEVLPSWDESLKQFLEYIK